MVSPSGWRARISAAFQDHAAIGLTAHEAVGLGDLRHLHDTARIKAAVAAGAAEQVIDTLPQGLATQLGTTWPGGVGLSTGQWQRLALARSIMRQQPLMMILDEPTAALDATTEHDLFEHQAAAAKERGQTGTVTLLITHRFSTVAAADLIAVLDNGRVIEEGTHAQLLQADGHYAELYNLQARGYK